MSTNYARLKTLLLFVLLFGAATTVFAEDWKPLEPAHLKASAPVVEKDADAEAIFWEVRLDDSEMDLVFNHYVRIKIFTERGKEAQSRIDIPYISNYQIKDIAGRTIKPDGTMIELKKDAVFDREIVKLSGIKLMAKTFAMPAVEPGVVIEYRWKEVRPLRSANRVRLHFQRDIPVQTVKYYVKPSRQVGNSAGMSTMTFQCPPVSWVKEKDGFYSVTMNNMPAFKEEPRMPPEDQVRAWSYVYYTDEEKQSPDRYWGQVARAYYEIFKPAMKVNDDVKKAAATIVGDAATPEQKLERIFNYCRTQIKNLSSDASGMTEDQRRKVKENNNPGDTLKRGTGDAGDIDLLFAALATAAGFDARLALCQQRDDMFFNPTVTIAYFLTPTSIAVRVGETWRFFNPGTTYIPFGMLRWQEEGIATLIADPKQPGFVTSPLSTPQQSLEKRTARMHLKEDGTLEGDVRIEYTGHLAYDMKEANDSASPEKREQTLIAMVKARLSAAELSNVKVENVTDPDKPFVYSYHIRVPGYAQRTGKRLFFQPAFFQRGVGALFPTSERRHSIYFNYPWSEEDVVQLDLPGGYELDNAESPNSFGIDQIGRYDVFLGVTQDRRTMEYRRKFFFGAQGRIIFGKDTYPTLKKIFDTIHEADSHTVSLKQASQ